MDIVIISQYLRNIEDFEGNNSRFVYLAKMLEENHDVEIITSDFMHAPKAHAKKIGELGKAKVTALHEPGYPRNVCISRFRSHKKLAKTLGRYLSQRKRPDVCYCAIPSLDVAYSAAQYCKKNNVRFIVDVQDLWPEAFKMVFNIPVISDIIFMPMQNKANKIYALADGIAAVSKTYANRAMSVNKKCKSPTVVFLGTEKDAFDSYAVSCSSNRDNITIGYVGSMSESYDLISVMDAISQIKTDVAVKFLAIGDGVDRESYIKYARQKGINAEFTGKLDYPQMVKQLMTCDIAVNPIRKGSAGSIINKVGDYAMAGLPVINTQECHEYRELLENYQAGINCECENSKEIAAALETLIANKELRTLMGDNSRRLGLECFDRKNSYKKLVRMIENESVNC
jgi:glycosyltransferase involved in cell wall biosynthesis